MGKFVFGLFIGVVLGVLAMTINPDLPQELRVRLASITAQVMRTAGETAEELGDAAEDLTDEAEPPATGEPPATAPATPTQPRTTPAPQ
jgi:gas vesicle protein